MTSSSDRGQSGKGGKAAGASAGKRRSGSGRVTLADVAGAAGVSVMTVSNVINGKQKGRVSEEKARRIMREIRRLKYRPHEAARNLRLARSSTVGMIIVNESRLFMSAPFISMLITGITNALAENELNLIVQGVHPDHFSHAAALKYNAVDGIIAHLSGDDKERARFQRILGRTGYPLVLIQDTRLARLGDYCLVNQDDFLGGQFMAKAVLNSGARRLLFIKPKIDWPAFLERERGVRAMLTERGLDDALDTLLTPDEGLEKTRGALRAYLETHEVPDAILGSNDHIAIAAMKQIQAMGLRVPQDVVITGYNDFEYRRYAEPHITSVASQVYEMGVIAGNMMIHRLQNGEFRERKIVIPVSLVPGDSTPRAPERAGPGRARRRARAR